MANKIETAIQQVKEKAKISFTKILALSFSSFPVAIFKVIAFNHLKALFLKDCIFYEKNNEQDSIDFAFYLIPRAPCIEIINLSLGISFGKKFV